MKKIVLHIDTSDNTKTSVGLSVEGTLFEKTEQVGNRSAQAVLPIVEKLLEEHSVRFEDLTAIEVNVGPGSYTGLRVGVSIANTLASTLRIPINGKAVGETVEPIYQ